MRLLHAVLVLGCLAWSQAVAAATVESRVTDQSGRPVSDAVVYASVVTTGVVARGAVSAARPLAGAIMDQQDRMFVPFVLPVEAGTAVSFPNRDNIRHHVYSFSTTKTFELPLYTGMPAAPVVFDKPGVVALGCNIHDWMLAYVYVVQNPHFARSDADGRAQVRDLAGGVYDLRVWHPRMRETPESTNQRLTLAPAGSGQAVFVISLKPEPRSRRPPPQGGGTYPQSDSR